MVRIREANGVLRATDVGCFLVDVVGCDRALDRVYLLYMNLWEESAIHDHSSNSSSSGHLTSSSSLPLRDSSHRSQSVAPRLAAPSIQLARA